MGKIEFEPDYTESFDIRNLRKQVWDIVSASDLETTKEVSSNVDYAVNGYNFWIAIKVLGHSKYAEVTEADIDNCIEEDNLDVDFTFVFTYGRCSEDIIWQAYTQNIIIINDGQLKQFLDKYTIENNVFDDLWDFASGENEKVVMRKREEIRDLNLQNRKRQMNKLLAEDKDFQKYIDFESKVESTRKNITRFLIYVNSNPILYKELRNIPKSQMLFLYYNTETQADEISGIFHVSSNRLYLTRSFTVAEYICISENAYKRFEKLNDLIENKASIDEIKKHMKRSHVLGKIILIIILSAIILFLLFR